MKQEYVYIYILTKSNHIHTYVVKSKHYYTFFLAIYKIVDWIINTYVYKIPVTVISVRAHTRYLELGMKRYGRLYSYIGYVTIFPIYIEFFEYSEIEKFCRGLEKTIRMRRKQLISENLIIIELIRKRNYCSYHGVFNEIENHNMMVRSTIVRRRHLQNHPKYFCEKQKG